MKRQILAVTIVVGAVLALPLVGRAQETVLSGRATDATDAVLPGVTVTALHVDSGTTSVAVTDAGGTYRIGAMRTGVYTITAELPGFTTATSTNVELLLGQRGVLNFRLSVSTVQEAITVTGEAPLIDTSQSKVSGNIDPRQMQALPVNGRNWMDLTMLAPGSRVNAIGDSPSSTGGNGLMYHLNMDGQQVTNLQGPGNPRFSRDSIAEFEFITNRFDATQGRSMGLQVNAISKSGTNRVAGTVSGYFRDDSLNAKDFIVNRVLPYSNQQVAVTVGGPIRKDRMHFFGSYEYEREPGSFTFTSVFPRFNRPPLTVTRTSQNGGGRVDRQFSANTRLTIKGHRYYESLPAFSVGGATTHISRGQWGYRYNNSGYATLTRVLGNSMVHEMKGGYTGFLFYNDGLVPLAPTVNLRGYSIGKVAFLVDDVLQHSSSFRNDLTFVKNAAGRHEFKIGGDVLYNILHFNDYATHVRDGVIDATGGPIPANIEDLFPVWNDFKTWNLAPLSPITRFYTIGVASPSLQDAKGQWWVHDPMYLFAGWLQDNWTPTDRLTLNLGLRYDLQFPSFAENLEMQPFLPPGRHPDKLNFQPRLGFAYSAGDKTVIRGGWGLYFPEISDFPQFQTKYSIETAVLNIPNDGRPDFAANPFNGPKPTYAVASKLPGRSVAHGIASPDMSSPYSYQTSIGVQQQIGQTMSVKADYVSTMSRRQMSSNTGRNANLTYHPITGANYPYSDLSRRLYPEWGSIIMIYSDSWSDYHGLETAFTKRFSNRWQASGTYTLSTYRDAAGAPTGPCRDPLTNALGPCPAGWVAAKDLGGDYTLGGSDQRHRAVFNGIYELPAGFQLSGLYFFGSGQRYSTSFGADLRDKGPGVGSAQPGLLRPDGTFVPRAGITGRPIHRVDLRLQQTVPIRGNVKVDGIFEVFNLFNHANHGSYTTSASSAAYGRPQQNRNVAYQPRIIQLGFRFAF